MIGLLKNFAIGKLTSLLNAAATSASLESGQGARFPSLAAGQTFKATLWTRSSHANPDDAFHAGRAERVLVTARTTDALTLTRAQEGTSAIDFSALAGEELWIVGTLGAEDLMHVRETVSGTTPTLTFSDSPKTVFLTTSGNTTFTLAGMAPGRRLKLVLTADALRTLAFAATHTWLECPSTGPGTIGSGKVMEIDFECDGTTAASVRAVHAVQP